MNVIKSIKGCAYYQDGRDHKIEEIEHEEPEKQDNDVSIRIILHLNNQYYEVSKNYKGSRL